MSQRKQQALTRHIRATVPPDITIGQTAELAKQLGVRVRTIRRALFGPNPRLHEMPEEVREKAAAEQGGLSRRHRTKGPAYYAAKRAKA